MKSSVRRLSILALGIAWMGLLASGSLSQPTAPPDANTVLIDGSSTVGPISQAVAAEFRKVSPDVKISVGVSGTSGGFRRFLERETDINDASRPIKPAEIEKARERGIEFIESLVAFDGLTVAVDRQTRIFRDGQSCMTLGELELLWSREAEGIVQQWNQLGKRFADARVRLSGAAETSGTFDFFTAFVNGEEGDTRSDYFATEEDQLLAEQTSQNPAALTYFGFAFFLNNQDLVQPVAVDASRQLIDAPPSVLDRVNRLRQENGKDPLTNGADACQGIPPNVDTISLFDYPLTRPLFIYTNAVSAERDAVGAFVDFYLAEERIGREAFLLDVGYVPAETSLRAAARRCWNEQITGSAFGGTFARLGAEIIGGQYLEHCGK